MIDFFNSIGELITNIIDFFKSTIETFKGIAESISGFFEVAGSVIAILPAPIQAIIYAALALLIAFIVIELPTPRLRAPVVWMVELVIVTLAMPYPPSSLPKVISATESMVELVISSLALRLNL